ncbi:hypothetical protein Y032_0213g2301 [Ancylostoma ceylanicum]|uniref:Uncharacterized protein n=1 Tax=Ancylostoma ceylanicum TaxID=53326 RepID=A0A016SKI2_9BILA|nr:hypothetical protein Y032_0213g2301 [Ancylostoma ceylanicum]
MVQTRNPSIFLRKTVRYSSAASGSPRASAAPSFRRSGRSDVCHTAAYYFINTCPYQIFSSSHNVISHKNKSVEVGIGRYHDYDFDL